MDKQRILRNYVENIYRKMDELRATYPQARSAEILEMEKGYRVCATKSSEWLEQFLIMLESTEPTQNNYDPMSVAVNNSTNHMNDISKNPFAKPEEKKKKSFLQVSAEASKDMMTDLFHAVQGTKRQ